MSRRREIRDQLAPQVLTNCRRSDAESAGRFSLCGLLLRLRNLYKWEEGLPPWREEDPAVMLQWVNDREELWLELGEQGPQPLTLDGRQYDPFDTQGLNALLAPHGLVYGAGRAGGLAPVFFLGLTAGVETVEGMEVHRLGREWGRDILFLPGLRQENQIFLRSSPLAYLLWDKLSDPRPTQLRFVDFGLKGYGLSLADLLRAPSWEALAPVMAGEMEAVLWHELGEAGDAAPAQGLLLSVIAQHPGSELEHFVRGVKDLLADTGPRGRLAQMIARRARAQLGFYPTWLAGFPRLLFPELDAAVMAFMRSGDWAEMEEVRQLGWRRAYQAMEDLGQVLDRASGQAALDLARREVIAPLTACRRTQPSRAALQ